MESFINLLRQIISTKRDNEKLQKRKLELEIGDLENPTPIPQPNTNKPNETKRWIEIIISTIGALASVGTLIIAQETIDLAKSSGLFDIEKATLANDKSYLENSKVLLQLEIRDFEDEKALLVKNIEKLKLDSSNLENDSKRLRDSTKTLIDTVRVMKSKFQHLADSLYRTVKDQEDKEYQFARHELPRLQQIETDYNTMLSTLDGLPPLIPIKIINPNGTEYSKEQYKQIGSITDTLRTIFGPSFNVRFKVDSAKAVFKRDMVSILIPVFDEPR